MIVSILKGDYTDIMGESIAAKQVIQRTIIQHAHILIKQPLRNYFYAKHSLLKYVYFSSL